MSTIVHTAASTVSSRRGFMGRAGTLSAVAVALLAGKE